MILCNNCNAQTNKNRKFCSHKCATTGKNNPSYKHGATTKNNQSKEYRTWAGIKKRCLNKNAQNYEYYGGRGIMVHQSWIDDFSQFVFDVGLAPTSAHSLDRKDSNGNYEPGNVRWATKAEQMNNRRDNVIIEYSGKKLTRKQWSDLTGINYSTLRRRLDAGWPLERVFAKQKLEATNTGYIMTIGSGTLLFVVI